MRIVSRPEKRAVVGLVLFLDSVGAVVSALTDDLGIKLSAQPAAVQLSAA